MKYRLSLLSLICLLMILAGCSSDGKKSFKCDEWLETPELKRYQPRKVAVLPFKLPDDEMTEIAEKENELRTELQAEKKKNPQDEKKIKQIENQLHPETAENVVDWRNADETRRIFSNAFSQKRFSDVESYMIDDRLKEKGFKSRRSVFKATPQELGSMLGADAIIYGQVIRFSEWYFIVASIKTIKVHAEMVSARDGTKLWEATNASSSWTASTPTSVFGIVFTLFETVSHYLNIQIVDIAYRCCNEMIETLDDAWISGSLQPKIDAFSVDDINGKIFKTGEKILVQMEGSPFNIAYVEIDGIVGRIYLREVTNMPGFYSAEYIVKKGDNCRDPILKAYLVSSDNRDIVASKAINSDLKIDTIPPPVPKEVDADYARGGVLLTWKKSDDTEISGYNIYRRKPGGFEYELIGTSKTPQYEDKIENVSGKIYYKVSAFDEIGNESEKSESVRP